MDVRGFVPINPKRGHNQILRPFLPESLGIMLKGFNFGGASSSLSWPLANLAIYVPIHIVEAFTIVEVAWENGTGTGGNVDLGIYDETGARLASLGSTDDGAASTLITSTTWTDYTITSPGLYYLAMSHSTTANIFGWAPVAGLCQALGIMEQQSALPLPATATFAATTRAFIPDCMFLARSTAL